MFALCCITYELLSCKHPYSRTPVNEALKKNIKVSKPANMPIAKWPIFSKIFSTGTIPADFNAKTVKHRLNKQYWPLATGVAASLLFVAGLGLVYNQQQVAISDLEAKLSQQNEVIQNAELLLSTSPEHSRSLIDGGAPLHPLIKAGLLRLHKPYLLGQFESEIDDVLNSDATSYPNYDEIEAILQKAKATTRTHIK